jgi:hypothetical protein
MIQTPFSFFPPSDSNSTEYLRVILYVVLMSFLCPSKNDLAFNIIISSKFNNNQSQIQRWF